MKREINGELLNVPEHVAVIMDGNGRWAKKRFLPRNYGHAEGAKALEAICENCDKLGIKYLTVYAFSTENWKRSVEEVTGIMNLFRKYLVDSIERSNNSNMKVNLIGKREGLPEDIVQKLDVLSSPLVLISRSGSGTPFVSRYSANRLSSMSSALIFPASASFMIFFTALTISSRPP